MFKMQGPKRPTSRAGRIDALPSGSFRLHPLFGVPSQRNFREIKADTIDAVAGHVEELSIQELLARANTLEGKVGRTSRHERGVNLTGSVAHIEEHVNMRLNLTMRAMVNQAPSGGEIPVSKAINTIVEEAKVTLAAMYLSEDVKLWWRSRYVDI
ncbi:uncharacterized protein E5676_scaffold606G001500 [Cucumis melo var. makuwa]|uniref:Uncharacterized protein n=1 Tax=Cucumis melo var. makuwa TaxID=1194695 RepID=A0A5D3C7L0_CUCMM|nr:uncharacterized protein E6C27_scaffold132G00850 [Cucumis melo var. makuwa]TYK07252.1 uncharacterized protein E5676_scaffold606G001500 [Cucumis melo var. makuwa]